jgi:hypothetical protein
MPRCGPIFYYSRLWGIFTYKIWHGTMLIRRVRFPENFITDLILPKDINILTYIHLKIYGWIFRKGNISLMWLNKWHGELQPVLPYVEKTLAMLTSPVPLNALYCRLPQAFVELGHQVSPHWLLRLKKQGISYFMCEIEIDIKIEKMVSHVEIKGWVVKSHWD